MAAPNHLTLLVPGLLGPWGMPGGALTEALSVPALERLLSRADPGAGQAGAMEALLFHAFGYHEPGADLPVGAVTAAVDLGDARPPWGKGRPPRAGGCAPTRYTCGRTATPWS